MNDPYSTPLRLTPELVAELAEWTARNLRARRAYDGRIAYIESSRYLKGYWQ